MWGSLRLAPIIHGFVTADGRNGEAGGACVSQTKTKCFALSRCTSRPLLERLLPLLSAAQI